MFSYMGIIMASKHLRNEFHSPVSSITHYHLYLLPPICSKVLSEEHLAPSILQSRDLGLLFCPLIFSALLWTSACDNFNTKF